MSVHAWILFVRRWAYSILRGNGDEPPDVPLGPSDQADEDFSTETEANRQRD